MDYGTLRNQYGETVDSTQPLPTNSAGAKQLISQSQTLTYNGKAVAGGVTVNATQVKPIFSTEGGQVASHWNLEKNKVYEAVIEKEVKDAWWLQSLVETATAATFTVYDPTTDLEKLFESATGTVKRYIAKVTDTKGAVLYGWIMGVAVSGSVHIFDVYNARLAETQSWVGVLDNFDNTKLKKVEIFKYNSSLVFGTGTTLLEEVSCPREYSKSWKSQLDYAKDLSNGQYFVDYMRGRIIGKRADTTASETITYNILSSLAVATSPEPVPGSTTGKMVPVDDFKDVATTDTAIRLNATTLFVRRLLVTAKSGNATAVWIGGSAIATTKGTPFIGPDRIEFNNIDLADLYINGVAGVGVTFTYFV